MSPIYSLTVSTGHIVSSPAESMDGAEESAMTVSKSFTSLHNALTEIADLRDRIEL